MGREFKVKLTFHEYRFDNDRQEKMGLSIVWRGTRLKDNAQVLVLIRFPGTDFDFPLPDRQIRELEQWKAHNSPHLLTFQDWGVMEEFGLVCFVLEPFHGEVLRHSLEAGRRWSPREAAHLLSGLLPALKAMRKRELFHGALVPENLLLVQVRLAAWGFGLWHNDLRYASLNEEGWIIEEIFRWSLPYVSPEAMMNKPVASGDQVL